MLNRPVFSRDGDVITLGEFLSDGFSGMVYLAIGLSIGALTIWPLGLITAFLFWLPLLAASAIFDVNTGELEHLLFSQSHGFYYYFSGFWAFIALFISCAYLTRRCDWPTVGPDPR